MPATEGHLDLIHKTSKGTTCQRKPFVIIGLTPHSIRRDDIRKKRVVKTLNKI